MIILTGKTVSVENKIVSILDRVLYISQHPSLQINYHEHEKSNLKWNSFVHSLAYDVNELLSIAVSYLHKWNLFVHLLSKNVNNKF